MKKIKTIFERDWKGNRKVIDKYNPDINLDLLKGAMATEKIDGTNIRITIRNKEVVRVEKRKNPTKRQKLREINDPWYVDADVNDPSDKYIFKAVSHRRFSEILDGEWSGEAFGEKIQGNPLSLNGVTVCLFSCYEAPVLSDAPITYEGLKEWLPKQKSFFGDACPMEGVVWHCTDGTMYKIKIKDF